MPNPKNYTFFSKKSKAKLHLIISSNYRLSVSAKINFMYRYRPIRKLRISVIIGIGWNEKKPFGRTLPTTTLCTTIVAVFLYYYKFFQKLSFIKFWIQFFMIFWMAWLLQKRQNHFWVLWKRSNQTTSKFGDGACSPHQKP